MIWAWINGRLNNREAGDLRRFRAHYDVTVTCHVKFEEREKSSKKFWISTSSSTKSFLMSFTTYPETFTKTRQYPSAVLLTVSIVIIINV